MYSTLWSEGISHLRELDISISELIPLSKAQFRSKLKAAILDKNKEDILRDVQKYKKLNYWKLSDEPFEMKQYFHDLTLQDARMKFALDTEMLRGIKAHFSSEPKFEERLWKCDFCLRIESIRHIKICPFFENERKNRDLNDQMDLISYFKDVMKIRMEHEES